MKNYITIQRKKAKKILVSLRKSNNTYHCDICKMLPKWNNEDLVLILDHINGNNIDNSSENLRLLCPNCNSQTKTFCGRNVKREITNYNCKGCNKNLSTTGKIKRKFCSQSCANSYNKNGTKTQKINCQEIDILKLLKDNDMNFSLVGRILGISDNAIRKHLNKIGA